MKITRITKIRGHRVFRDFAWPNDLQAFAQFNVIYGWNGCGKTTLSSLLLLVERRVTLSEGEIELEFDGTTKVTGTELGTQPLPQVRVFNRDFVNATLHSSGDIAPIYFLGEGTIEKEGRVAALRNDLARANADLMTALNEKRTAESNLDNFCITNAKLIKELLTTTSNAGYNNYDKRRFKQAIEQLTLDSATAALLSEETKALLRSQKDAQPKSTIERVVAPSVDLTKLSAEVERLIDQSVVAHTLDELTTDTEVGTWVRRGIALHSGIRHSNTCRFCHEPLSPDRRSALAAHFNDALATFQHTLDLLAAELESAKQSLSSPQLPQAALFYEHLVDDAKSAIKETMGSLSAAARALEAHVGRLNFKRENPFSSLPHAPADQPEVMFADDFSALNAIVDKHNRTTEDFQRSVKEACENLERSYLGEAYAEYVRLAQTVGVAVDSVEEAKRTPANIQSEIDALDRRLLEHRRPAEELTSELSSYLGRDELRFEVRGSGYALMRGTQPVSHLSEGERTAIAFLYFLKSLQDKTFDMVNGVVVIDDPVSSLDASALFSAFGYMKERTKQCGQLFILTHSFSFFRLVKNWFRHLPGSNRKKVDRRPGRLFLLRSHRHSDGSRTSQLAPIDRLLEEHESEYQYLFKRVYDEAHRPAAASLEQHYGLPNIARRLLESFLAFRFPEMSGDLGPRVDRIAFDGAKKTRILRLLNTYSHASAIADPEHDLSLLAETQPVLLDMLDMMKVVDKDHYEGLEKLLTRGDLAQEGS